MSSPVAPSPPRHRRPGARARLVAPLLIAVAATVAYGLLSTHQVRNLTSSSWDLAIFSQLARDYAELRTPIVPIKGDGVNLLGDHFHPILVLLGPIWAIWPSGLALLWTQAVLFGASAIPIARLAMERLGTPLGILLGAGYAFSFGLQSAQDVQFHEIAFAVPLMAMALTRLLRGQVMTACLWAGALVLVKEDLGLTVAVLGAIIALRGREHRLEGTGLALWGIGWFILSTFVILPALNPAGHYDYTGNLGSILDVFLPVDKWVTGMMLVLAAGVIGLRSPLILLMVPTLGWRFTGTVEFYWTWYWHYNAILMPVAAAALIDGAQHARRWTQAVAVAASVAVTLALGTTMPLWSLARPETWDTTWRRAPAEVAIAAVPAGSVVAADITLMPELIPDHDVQWVHGPNARVPACVVTDEYAFSWGGSPPAHPEQWADEQYHQSAGTFTVKYADGGFTVACR